MTVTYVLMQNLKRNPLRTSLTLVAFALPMAVFVFGISLVIGLAQLRENAGKEMRLAVQNKIALVNAMPERLRKDIEALDPDKRLITAVCGFRWFGGRVPNSQGAIQSLGVDHDTFPFVFSDLKWTPEETESWLRDRRACIVGSNVAEQYNWQLGQRITLESTVPPYLSLEFTIVKISNLPGRSNSMYLRRDYFEEARNTAGFKNPGCNVFWLRCAGADTLRAVQNEVDAHFANSLNETKTLDENAFGAQFIESAGDLPGLFGGIAVVVVVIVALVAGNTMMMSFRERARELAVFKAIGFQGGRIFRIVLAESVLLAVTGALIGIVPVALIVTAFPVKAWPFIPPSGRIFLSMLVISPIAVGVALVISLVVGLIAGIVPAYQSLRLNTVTALRRVG